MPLKSSPGWAFGAISLAIVIACTPTPEQSAETQAAPVTDVQPQSEPARPPLPPVTADTPGFVGLWAETVAACAEPDTGITLTTERIDMPVDKRSCAITSIREEHPSGRAVNYAVEAACATGGAPSRDTFRFELGPADTIMQLRMGEAPPVRLERCPSIATP